MKKLVYLFVFISGSLFAQEDVAAVAQTGYNKILIGISASPDYAYRTLFSENGLNNSAIIADRNKNERGKFGYTFGLNFNYNFNQKWGLITGVLYSNKGYQSIYDYGETLSLTTIYNYYYLDIPLKIIYKIGKGKFRFISGLGITTNILRESAVKSITEQNGDKNEFARTADERYKQLNFSPGVSIGVESTLKQKHVIRIEPSFNFGLLGISDALITANLWSAGINFSYYFGLKKSPN